MSQVSYFASIVKQCKNIYEGLAKKFNERTYIELARALRKAGDVFDGMADRPVQHTDKEKEGLELSYRQFLTLKDKKRAILIKNSNGRENLFHVRARPDTVDHVEKLLKETGHKPRRLSTRNGKAITGYNIGAVMRDYTALDLFQIEGVQEVRSPSVTYKFD